MAESFKVLGQSAPAAATLTDLITVPASTQHVVSTLQVCNTSSTQTTFRVAVSPAGAAITGAHYQYYDAVIDGNTSVSLTLGMTLDATDKLRVYATLATLSFTAFGTAITP